MNTPQRPTVLVVEDEPLIRMLAVDSFFDAGFEVLEAEHAAQALSVHGADRSIQLLFTDVNMPGELNGIDLAERIKALQPSICIIITSAIPIQRSVDHISASFVAKPYSAAAVCLMGAALLAR